MRKRDAARERGGRNVIFVTSVWTFGLSDSILSSRKGLTIGPIRNLQSIPLKSKLTPPNNQPYTRRLSESTSYSLNPISQPWDNRAL